jgi:hypothetical protein
MDVQISGATHYSTALDASILTEMVGLMQTLLGLPHLIVMGLMHSRQIQHNGAMKTAMATAAIKPATMLMSAPMKRVHPMLTALGALTAMVMDTQTLATPSLMTECSGQTPMVTTGETIQTVQTPTLTPTTHLNGRTRTVTDLATTSLMKTTMESLKVIPMFALSCSVIQLMQQPEVALIQIKMDLLTPLTLSQLTRSSGLTVMEMDTAITRLFQVEMIALTSLESLT